MCIAPMEVHLSGVMRSNGFGSCELMDLSSCESAHGVVWKGFSSLSSGSGEFSSHGLETNCEAKRPMTGEVIEEETR